jgi:YgiT-type zinc finger domain-containing protein
MNCLICRQAEIVDGFASVNFERKGMKLVVNSVPAQICPSCGETYVEEEVAVRLLRAADEMFQTGMRADVIEYPKRHPKKSIHNSGN